MMREKPYYSVRTGKHPLGGALDLPTVLRVLSGTYERLEDEGYFQEALGFECVDAGFIAGTAGKDLGGYVLFELRKTHLLPFRSKLQEYSEDDLFDVLKVPFDPPSKPPQPTDAPSH